MFLIGSLSGIAVLGDVIRGYLPVNLILLFVFVNMGIIMVIIMETIKQYKKMWNEISQMFLIGSLSGIAVLGDVTRKYLPVNLILLFILINMGIMLLRIYLRKKFDYM